MENLKKQVKNLFTYNPGNLHFEAKKLQNVYSPKTMEYKILSKIIQLNIQIEQLDNECFDLISELELLADD